MLAISGESLGLYIMPLKSLESCVFYQCSMNVVFCVCYKDMKLKEWERKWKTWYPDRYLVLKRFFWMWERKNFCGDDQVDLSESFHSLCPALHIQAVLDG